MTLLNRLYNWLRGTAESDFEAVAAVLRSQPVGSVSHARVCQLAVLARRVVDGSGKGSMAALVGALEDEAGGDAPHVAIDLVEALHSGRAL